MKPSKLFCFKNTKKLAALFFPWQQANAQPYPYDANESTQRLVEDRMNTELSSTPKARGFSVLYHVFDRKQCILCSGLCHKSYLTLLLIRFEIFSPFRTFAHGSIRLPHSSLTSLRGCLLAIILQLRLPQATTQNANTRESVSDCKWEMVTTKQNQRSQLCYEQTCCLIHRFIQRNFVAYSFR